LITNCFMVGGYKHKCGVANIHRVEICCIVSRGTTGEFVGVSQVIFMPIVMFIEKIGPHPTSMWVTFSSHALKSFLSTSYDLDERCYSSTLLSEQGNHVYLRDSPTKRDTARETKRLQHFNHLDYPSFVFKLSL
jgi:hypothetical protein